MKKVHEFWDKQPIAQCKEQLLAIEFDKSVDIPKTQIDIVQKPLTLPDTFYWYDIDINDPTDLNNVYELLCSHYVEGINIRFAYDKDFLVWALKPPGWKREWHLSIRNKNGIIVGFISAIPVNIVIRHHIHKMVEINFLCVHKKLRQHRMTPVLIKEITRRANVNNIFQAIYTTGITLPTPITTCQYYHRFLNPKKLVEIGFSSLKSNMTITRLIKLYKLPTTISTIGLRLIQKEDHVETYHLLTNYLKKFNIYKQFDIEYFEHCFSTQDKILNVYVVEDLLTHQITDMVSFYSIPSTILNNSKYQTLHTAYLWYIVSTKTPIVQLVHDMLIIAHNMGFDVFNCLNILDNNLFIDELKFVPGSGRLNYYLFNWLTKPIEPKDIGIIMV